MRREVREAVFGNVGSIISFRVGLTDARMLANEFGSGYSPEQFTELANYEVRVKLLEQGEYREPFLASTFPAIAIRGGNGQKLIRRSRERFGTRRAVVESKIGRWLNE